MAEARKGACTTLTVMCTGALSLVVGGACAGNVSSGDPTEARTSEEKQALAVNLCQPLTCCFPSGGGWSDNPFEKGLQALGCTEPQAYAESLGQSSWWKFSRCPASLDLTAQVLKYALVSPYYSQVAINACLELQAVAGGQATSAFVEWDPTCPSCYYSYSSYWFYTDPYVYGQYAAYEQSASH